MFCCPCRALFFSALSHTAAHIVLLISRLFVFSLFSPSVLSLAFLLFRLFLSFVFQQTHCPRETYYQVITVLEPTPLGQSYTSDCSKLTWTEGDYIGSYTCKCLMTGEWDFAQCGYWQDVCKRACHVDRNATSANGVPLNADWPGTARDETATILCPAPYSGSVSRKCAVPPDEGAPQWEAVQGECVKH